mgnify:CR=1 FL=1
MVSEERWIAFSPPELCSAVSAYTAKVTAMPGLQVLRLTPAASPDLPPGAVLAHTASRQHPSVTLTPVQLTCALITYCFARRIPLPKDGRKRVDLDGDRAVLHVAYANQRPPPADGAVRPSASATGKTASEREADRGPTPDADTQPSTRRSAG